MRRTIAILTGAVLLAGTGCSTIQVDLPDPFLVTTATPHEFKAITAENALFWVEKYQLPARGDNLAFWVTALRQDFVDRRGYTLLEDEPIRTQRGVPGVQMLFEATIEGQAWRYLVAVFVRPGPVVCVARFTAPKADFATHVTAVKQAILTTRD
jgi:hypothetical protein